MKPSSDEGFILYTGYRLTHNPPVSRRSEPPASYSCRPSFTSELAVAHGKWN